MKRFFFAAVLLLVACGQPTSHETNEAYPVAVAPNYDATIVPTVGSMKQPSGEEKVAAYVGL